MAKAASCGRCIQPFIYQLLLRVLLRIGYSSCHRASFVDRGIRDVLNPIIEYDQTITYEDLFRVPTTVSVPP